MSQHKALVLKQGNFEVDHVPTEKPGKGEIRVKIHSTALNPVDWKIKTEKALLDGYRGPPIFGSDSAGTVDDVGEGVTGFKKGDKVLHQGYFNNRTSTFQQYTIVPAEIAAKIPDNISFDQAATIPLGLATAAVGYYDSPEKQGAGLTAPWDGGEGQSKGEGILIFGGSSSVGQYAIQLARLSGFSPIVTTASPHNTDLVKSLGATHVIDRKADVVAESKKVFTTPPNIVYDAISEDTQEQAWSILAPGGTLILVLPPHDSLKTESQGKKCGQIFGNVHVQRELGVKMYAHLTEMLASGKIVPNRVEVLSDGLAGIPAGLKRMEENKVSGVKLIARPQETK